MATVTKTVHIGGQVPEPLAQQFATIAHENERAVAAELRLALKAHVERHEAGRDPEGAAA